MSPSQIIVLATPAFLLLIAIEFAWGHWRQRTGKGRQTYRLNDAISSISLGMLSQVSAVFTRLLRIGLYTAVFTTLSLVPTAAAREFWMSWYGWLLALLFYDLCYYWLHRLSHETAVLWAAHVVHHQSQDYNLSTALRQTSSGALFGWVFYLPMAVAGVPPLVFGVVGLIDLLYQFWVHTEQVPRLGWFDRWFCSPSNHRVHHAVNARYLDRNYGGILIIWDRLFGSFTEEDEQERCVYGTRKPLNSWDPLWANAEVYWRLMNDSRRTPRWRDKLRIWFKPPGWRPLERERHEPRRAFNPSTQTRFHPPMTRAMFWFAIAQFGLLLQGVAVFLWSADSLPLPHAAIWCAVLVAGLWGLGAVLQGRISMLQCLALEAAALAAASASLDLLELHRLSKPLAMLLLIADVWTHVGNRSPGRAAPRTDAKRLLMLALLASLAGDVLLMVEGYFVPGLIAFLLAHLCYLRLFSRDARWFASRRALLATLAIGVLMSVFLWLGGLPHDLRLPVAAYVLVIALMAAQAIGRSVVLRDRASVWVALGAALFMLSDALLATDRFVMTLPYGRLWVLSTYYAAQILIARHVLDARSSRTETIETGARLA